MDRLFKILQILNNSKVFVHSNNLAQEFNVTTRTIRNDLIMLERILKDTDLQIIKKRNQGISLNKKVSESELLDIFSIANEKDFYSYSERENIIIETLLLSKQPVTINQLVELTLSSKSSLSRNLATCEERFDKWSIVLCKKTRSGLSISYSEHNWRMFALEHIMQYLEKMDFLKVYHDLAETKFSANLPYNKFINRFIKGKNTLYISNFIHRYEANNHIKFTDEAFISVLLYICIAITRAEEGYSLKSSDSALERFFEADKIESLFDSSINFLNKGLDIVLDRIELEAILIYMLSQKKVLENGITQSDSLIADEMFNQKSLMIVKQFIYAAQAYLNVDLISDNTLFENLLLHIRPTIFRLLFGIKLENPLKEDVMKMYPEVFAACKVASKVLTIETNSPIDDNEICYLAIHIEASIEKSRGKRFSDFYKVLVVCPEGNGTSSILHYRLLSSFPNIIIERICTVTELSQINKENIDLIISTVPIYSGKEDRFNVIDVNPLLYDKDIARIQRAMKRIDLVKNSGVSLVVEDIMEIVSSYTSIYDYDGLKKSIDHYFNQPYEQSIAEQETLKSFIKPSLVSLNQEVNDWQEAFSLAGSLLYNEGYIDNKYIDCMINATKEYGAYMIICDNVALPHAKPTDGVNKTGFSFVTLKNSVIFQSEGKEYPIKLVIALAADGNYSHLTAMGELIDLICDEDKLNELLNMTDTNMFIKYMKENS